MLRFCVAALALFACISLARSAEILTEPAGRIIISVRDQKLMFVQSGVKPITYRVSTSKFRLGDDWGRMTTPLGFLQIGQKIGDNAPREPCFTIATGPAKFSSRMRLGVIPLSPASSGCAVWKWPTRMLSADAFTSTARPKRK